MRYVEARLKKDALDTAYRIYITDSLRSIPQRQWLTVRFADLIEKPTKPVDTRSGDDIAVDIITRLRAQKAEA